MSLKSRIQNSTPSNAAGESQVRNTMHANDVEEGTAFVAYTGYVLIIKNATPATEDELVDA